MCEVIITKENFEAEVMHSEKPVLVDFWAAWCGPCSMLGPVISNLAKEYKGRLKVCKVNVDEEEELANRFGIKSIPTVLFLKDGQLKKTLVGYRPEEELAAEFSNEL